MNKKILFTVANNSGSVYLAKEFKRNGFKVFMGDLNPDAIGRFFADSFFVLPAQSSVDYIPSLKGLVEAEGIEILVPAGESECLKLAQYKSEFETLGCMVVVADVNTLETSIDKGVLYDFLSENTDIPMMRYHKVSHLEDFELGLEKLKNYPLCMKPSTGSGSRGFVILRNSLPVAEEFFNAKKEFSEVSTSYMKGMLESSSNIPALLLMEMLQGRHYDSNVIAKDGEVIFQSIRTREEAINGTITKGQVVRNCEIEEINAKIVKALGTTGYICTQYIGNKLVEVNPRWSTSMNYGEIDEYLMSIKLTLGLDIQIAEEDVAAYEGVKMLRYFDVHVYK